MGGVGGGLAGVGQEGGTTPQRCYGQAGGRHPVPPPSAVQALGWAPAPNMAIFKGHLSRPSWHLPPPPPERGLFLPGQVPPGKRKNVHRPHVG